MKNIFRENRVVWDEKPSSDGEVQGGISSVESPVDNATVDVATGDKKEATTEGKKEVPEQKEKVETEEAKKAKEAKEKEEALKNRKTLRDEIEGKKDVLYKKIGEKFDGRELSLEKNEEEKKAVWLKKKVWGMAMAMDKDLWKDIGTSLKSDANVWQSDEWKKAGEKNPVQAFSTAGKQKEVFADMFTKDVIAELKAPKNDEDVVLFSFEYKDGFKVVQKSVKKTSAEYQKIVADEKTKEEADAEKEQYNYKAMSKTLLKEGGFVIGFMSMIGIIPNKAVDGKSVAELQEEAIERGLKGEDPVLGWIFGLIGIKGCEGAVSGLDTFFEGTPFGETYGKVKTKIKEQEKKYLPIVKKTNESADTKQEQEAVSKVKVLDNLKIGEYSYTGGEGLIFNTPETVKTGCDLEIVIPYAEGTSVTFGGTIDEINNEGGTSKILKGTPVVAEDEGGRTILIPSGKKIPQGTVFKGKDISYQYVKHEEAVATDATAETPAE